MGVDGKSLRANLSIQHRFENNSLCPAVSKMHNYYGMVEQAVSIYMEGRKVFFHCSNFLDVKIIEPGVFGDERGFLWKHGTKKCLKKKLQVKPFYLFKIIT